MPGLSAIIICKDEEQHIAAAIESLLWADEVLIVDSFSTDNTLQIAAQYPVKISQRTFDNYSWQRNWAIDQASHSWILMLDADERISPELQQEALQLLRNTPGHAAYEISRKNYFMGELVRFSGWQNDRVVRLFHKDYCRYSDKNVHEVLQIKGSKGKLQQKILHYTYKSLPHYLKKWDQYSWLSAKDKLGKTPKVTVFHLAIKPLVRFIRQYFFKLGILDGRVGLIIACLSAGSVFMRYLKVWRIKEENINPIEQL